MSVSDLKLDKTVISVASLTDESGEKAYWQTRTPGERLQMMELLREVNYGHAATSARLQRVLSVIELGGS
jgi:hypothetical protein